MKMRLSQYEKHMNALKNNANYYISMVRYYDEEKNEGKKQDYRDSYMRAKNSAKGYIEAIKNIYGEIVANKLQRYYDDVIDELEMKRLMGD